MSGQSSKDASRTLAAAFIVIFLFYLAQAQFRPLLPRYLEQRGGSESVVGFVIFLNWLVQAVFSVPFGSLSDRIGRRSTMVLGGLIAAVGFAALPSVSTVFLIMLVYMAAGLGQAGYSAATATYSVDMARTGGVSRAIGWTQAARQSAFSFGPALGGVLAALLGVEEVFIISAVLALAGVVLSRLFLPDIRPNRTAAHRADGDRPVTMILRNRVMLASLIGVFSLQFSNSVFSSFTPIYANQLSYTALGIVFAVQGVMNAVGRPVIGELSSRIRRRSRLITLSMLSGAVGLFTLSLSSEFEPLLAVAVLVGLSTGIGVVLLMTIIAEKAHEASRGFAMGFFTMFLYLGLGVGPAVEGVVIENLGYPVAFQTAGLVSLTGLIVFYILTRLDSKAAKTSGPLP